MENGLFLRAPSSDLLEKGFVEARLHTDSPDQRYQRNLDVRDKYGQADDITRPIYYVVDPKTLEAKGSRRKGVFRGHEDLAAFLSAGKSN